MIRSTIYSGITGSLRCRHSAGIQGTPPFNFATAGDGAFVGLRCRVVLLSSRPPAFARQVARAHRDFVRFSLALPSLFEDRAAHYMVVVWSGIDVLSILSRVVRGVVSGVVVCSGVAALVDFSRVARGVVSGVVVWSAIDVLINFLRVVREAVSGVVVWSGAAVLINFLRVVRGAGVTGVVVWSGVDVLTDFLRVV